MSSPKVRLQQVLRDLFRLNCADLDFGWFRVVNLLRSTLEEYMEQYLDRIASEVLAQYSLDVKSAEIIYNHLASFFNQCARWETPSKREKNLGKEVLSLGGTPFVWDDINQYYVSSTQTQRRVKIRAGGWHLAIIPGYVNIVLGNVDKNTYFWMPAPSYLQCDVKQKEIGLIIEFRPLTSIEHDHFAGSRNKQEEIFSEIAANVFQAIADTELAQLLGESDLQSTLNQILQFYTKLGNRDIFIHHNLSSFLLRRWDEYVTQSWLQIPSIVADRGASGNDGFEAKLRSTQAASVIMKSILGVLTKLEEIQREVYLASRRSKKVEYCIPWHLVPANLRDEVFRNADQLAEWKILYNLAPLDFKGIPPQTFIDTKFFVNEFQQQLISSNKDLQESYSGFAILGDNYQSLLYLREKFKNRVKMIYIDPPYNKGNSEFLYRDGFRSETWDILMRNVLELARDLLREDGMIFVSIDDNRVHELALLLKGIFGPESHIATMPVKSNPRGRSMEKFVATSHEYLLFFAKNLAQLKVADNALTPKQVGEYNKEDPKLGPYRLLELRNRNPQFARHNRPNLYYPIYLNQDTGEFGLDSQPNLVEILPKNTQGRDGVWRWSKEKFLANIDRIVIKRVKRVENPYNVYKKDFLYNNDSGDVRQSKHKTFLEDKTYNYQNGKRTVREMFGETLFGNPKPLALIDKCLDIATNGEESIVLDFFAGSGTTGHAVIERMKRGATQQKYILVEIGQIFHDALLPRLKKASYASNWANGKPQDQTGWPHVLKYLELESYEEALDRVVISVSRGNEFDWRFSG